MAKNLSEYVIKNVIDYLSGDKYEIYQKLEKLGKDSLVIDFLSKVDVSEFEDFLHFKRFSFTVHETHECPKCHKIFNYLGNGGGGGGDVEWHSGDTEFDNNIFEEQAFTKKYYPCCDRTFTSWYEDDDAEED